MVDEAVGLSLAVSNYDRIMALALGDVRPEGIDLDVRRLPTPEVLARAEGREFDASEFSISRYVELRDRGDRHWQAIPVFLSRFFRHWSIYVNAGAGVGEPADLRGKRAGVLNYRYTSSVWVRGFLQHDHGVRPADLRWIQAEPTPPPADPDVELETRPGADLGRMLLDGEIDVLIAPYAPAALGQPGSPIRRLLPDAKERERAFYRRTGVFPQMHTVVIRTDALERDPRLAQSLYTAFCRAKDWSMQNLRALRLSLPWLWEQVEELHVLMGPDHWPYGLEANRAGLELLVRYMVEQRLIGRDHTLEEFFLAFD